MPMPKQIKDRYEIRRVLGHGGMGVVYDAYDTIVKRGVALKTVRDVPNRAALNLFYKECEILASISHPNIVEIFDLGEFEEDGVFKPYFVMPFLPGKTLGQLIAARSSRLVADRVVEIICQTCRGLQAAHEQGLIHRDLKPSNILVMDDDSVKIIDFGIAHMADANSTVGQKGTLLYMAPEQVELKAPSPLSDIFSTGVVCYEAVTLRHPFERGTAGEVATAIVRHIPPPASELNPLVNGMIGRVIHKAIAKQPWYRFGSAREFAEALQKAVRNEAIETFDPARIQPRIERVRKTFQQGDYQFADEILTELEVEGYVDEAMVSLRRCINDSQRQKMLTQLLESANTRAEQQEYPLALQKLQELLAIDPGHGAALALKASIENKRSEQKIEDWFRLAHQHMEQNAYNHARQAIQNVLELKPRETRALKLMAEVDRREQEFVRVRQEQDHLYADAMAAWQGGDVSAALSKLERLVTLDRQSNDRAVPERSSTFQNFYNQVRSEHDSIKSAYEHARRHLVDRNFEAALEICKEQLAVHSGQALFQALKFDVEESQRQELSHFIAKVDRQVEMEPDLEKRVSILAEALQRHPDEAHFERALRTMREKRDLMNSIVAKARFYEDRSQYADALSQWEILKTIYSEYPGLDFEVERVRRRRDQQLRSNAKAKWVEQIDWLLGAGDHAGASDLLRSAAAEFPDDPELVELEKLATQAAARGAEAQKLLLEAQGLSAEHRLTEAIAVLRRAQQIDDKNSVIRAALTGVLLEQARLTLDSDWRSAGELSQQALQLDPGNAEARSLCTLAMDRQRDEAVERWVTQVRRLATEGQIQSALQQVSAALAEFPNQSRLAQLRSTLLRARSEGRVEDETAAATSAEWAEVAGAPPSGTTVVLPQPGDESMPPPPTEESRPIAGPSAVSLRRSRFLVPLIAVSFVMAILLTGALIVRSKKRPQPIPAAPRPAPAALAVTPPSPVQASPVLRVSADIEGGRIVLDDQPIGELEDGLLALKSLAPGPHTLKIGGFTEQATIRLEMAAGGPVIESLTAKEAVAIAVTGSRGHVKIQSSLGSSQVSVDGKPAGEMRAAGLELNGLAPGTHELTVGDGKEHYSMSLAVSDEPSLTAFLKSARSVGTLVVVTEEDGVRVWLNRKEQSRQTKKGQLRIPGLPARTYTIRVAKDGFLDVPEQQVEIRKGEDGRVEFHLRPVIKAASLSIDGGIPGTEVVLDQTPLGVVRDDGSFAIASVQPGDHVIELRKEFYKGKKIEKHFEAGGIVQLASADAALEELTGTLRIKVSPADARVTISRAGESPKPVSGPSINVAEGSYALSASAPNHSERSMTISVSPGENKSVELILERIVVTVPVVHGMSDWDDSAGWVAANNRYIRKGGNFVGYKPTPINGTFVFTIERQKGKRLQWVAERIDGANYLLFQMDNKLFYRNQVSNGKEKQLKKVPHGLEKQSLYTIQIDVAEGSIVHKLWDGSKWTVLDDWREAGRNFPNGKFGFLLPGSDTIALANFTFTPK